MCPAINSPGEPASLLNLNVLKNWNNYQVATWGSPGAPRRVNLAGVKRQTGTGLYKVNTIKYYSLHTSEAVMYSSLFISFVCVWSPHTDDLDPCRWGETHMVPRPPTWGHMSPQSGQGSHSCGQRAPTGKQARSLGPPEILERSVVTVSSPHKCPWEVRPLLFSLSFCVIFFCWFESSC